MKKVLFLCTGNYYRSRFAELYFNYLAEREKLDWTADSRGLAIELGWNHIGTIAPVTVETLEKMGIPVKLPQRPQTKLSVEDLEKADLTIALYDNEHRPFVTERFPDWLERIEFWKVPDIDEITPDIALPAIQKQVDDLVKRLSNSSS